MSTTAIRGIVIGHNNQCITACPEHDYTKPQSLKISTYQGRELSTIMIHINSWQKYIVIFKI